MYLCVYLPEELDLVDKEGPWTEQFHWGLSDTLNFRPIADPNDYRLLNWVAPGEDLGESFPTDGRLYVFSSLRPAPPPDGSLRLVAVSAGWLTTCVIGAVALVGLLLVPCRAGWRVLVVGAFVVALVICGAFYPILLWQICDGALASACSIVLVVWGVWHLVWTRPRAIARRGAREVDRPPPGPQPAPRGPVSPFAGPSGDSEIAIQWDPSKVEEPSEVILIEEPPGERPPAGDASAKRPSQDDPSKADRGEGGPTDA
ncbi:MAG TPA: hypothetical protein VMY37_38990 [Thermoguttaceae bacterium]|nr:hypothetical protein [Thermoguttaceae bacterium]